MACPGIGSERIGEDQFRHHPLLYRELGGIWGQSLIRNDRFSFASGISLGSIVEDDTAPGNGELGGENSRVGEVYHPPAMTFPAFELGGDERFDEFIQPGGLSWNKRKPSPSPEENGVVNSYTHWRKITVQLGSVIFCGSS